jgi:nitroreductase
LNVIEAIYARRSIRKFEGRPVEREKLTKLCRLGAAAPSAMNFRPWVFVIVDEEKQLARVRAATMFGRFPAPAAIVVCGNTAKELPGAKDFWVQDCAAAMENILLGAVELGLGAVWIGVAPVKPAMWALARVLKLPRRVRPLGIAYIGYPAEEREPRTQFEEGMVKWNRWG